MFDSLRNSKFKATIGGSFVSKFNEDNNTPLFNLPKNVGASSFRANLRYNKWRFNAENIGQKSIWPHYSKLSLLEMECYLQHVLLRDAPSNNFLSKS